MTERFGRAAYIVKARTHLMRDLGVAAEPPQNAFPLLNLGLETLFLARGAPLPECPWPSPAIWRHEKNLPGSLPRPRKQPLPRPCAEIYAERQLRGDLLRRQGRQEAAAKFMESLKLAAIVVHVADARTSVLHPASTTHRQMTDEQLVEAGVSAI